MQDGSAGLFCRSAALPHLGDDSRPTWKFRVTLAPPHSAVRLPAETSLALSGDGGGWAVRNRRVRGFADGLHQNHGVCRNPHLSVKDVFLVGVWAIQGPVSGIIGLDDSAAQADPGKDSPAARISENFRMQLNIRCRRRASPHGSRGGGDIATDSKFIVKELLQSPAPAEYQDDIR